MTNTTRGPLVLRIEGRTPNSILLGGTLDNCMRVASAYGLRLVRCRGSDPSHDDYDVQFSGDAYIQKLFDSEYMLSMPLDIWEGQK